MAKTSDLKVPFSGLTHIDALLSSGPAWNFLTPGTNTLYYSFSIASNLEQDAPITAGSLQAFSAVQQANARLAMEYISSVTGINFVETNDASKAVVLMANGDITGDPTTSGICSWGASTSSDPNSGELLSYTASAYVYMDNKEFASEHTTLNVGTRGYETLLHELGHMLGLKHPFSGTEENSIKLSTELDNTTNTLMSYKEQGGPYKVFSPFDLAALNWLYGGDGLGGALGIGSSTGARYVTGTSGADTLSGTSADDMFNGLAGNDSIDGGAGSDTLILAGASSDYSFATASDGSVIVTGTDGKDTLRNIEKLKFSNGSFNLSSLLNLDTTPPAAPTISASLNSASYLKGNILKLSGNAEAGSTVQVFNGVNVLGSATANASGQWTLTTGALNDGSYSLSAKATDAAGNTSTASASLSVKVDTVAAAPGLSVSKDANGQISGNQPVFSGSGEAGASIKLYQGSTEIASTTVGSDGNWSVKAAPQANGNYAVVATQTDLADNTSAKSAALNFSINSSLNSAGSAGKDVIVAQAGNNHIDAGTGIDVVQYSGARANYTVQRTANGYLVTDKSDGSVDLLQNVERLQFGDAWLAIDVDGIGGQIYRIYQAVFGRAPDKGGAGYWMSRLADSNLKEIAAGFMSFPEFADKFGGATPSDEVFVTKLYNNVLNRAPDTEGYNFWMGILKQGHARADVLIAFSEFPENFGNAITLIGNGYEFTPFP